MSLSVNFVYNSNLVLLRQPVCNLYFAAHVMIHLLIMLPLRLLLSMLRKLTMGLGKGRRTGR